jgi:hypothetical protein
MSYREIRVRPVVRYVVTDFTCDDDYGNHRSIPFGEFDNVDRANVVAYALAEAEAAANGSKEAVVEPARKLRIDWIRGSGEPKEHIRWELSEVHAEPPQPNGPVWRAQKDAPRITSKMKAAGERALLSAFSDEYLNWRSPGLESAVCRVFSAMLADSTLALLNSEDTEVASTTDDELRDAIATDYTESG